MGHFITSLSFVTILHRPSSTIFSFSFKSSISLDFVYFSKLERDLPPTSLNKMQFFLLVSTVITLTAAAPERQGRAAPEYEGVCKASAEAYRKAKAEGKPAKIAGVIAAKTFYVGFFNSKISGIVPACKNTVDATQSKSVASMVKYFNTATSNDLNVVTPICKAATVAYFNAKIDGRHRTKPSWPLLELMCPCSLKIWGQ